MPRLYEDQRLRLMQDLVMAVGQAPDFEGALEVMLRRLCHGTGWVFGQVWVPDREGAAMVCADAYYAATDDLKRFRIESRTYRFPPGVGLPGRVWVSRGAEWIRDVTVDANFPRAALGAETGLKAGMGVPIMAGSDVVAVVELFGREARERSESLMETISTVAGQLGALIRRKRSENALRISETRFRELLALLPVAVYVCDREGRILRYNRAAVELWGREPVVGDPAERFCGSYGIYRPDGTILAREDCPMAQTLRTGLPVNNQEIVIERPDGVRKTVVVNTAPLTDDEERLDGAINSLVDITERKRAEEACRAGEERYRALVDGAQDAIFSLSPKGLITSLNPAFESITGWARFDWQDRHYSGLIAPGHLPLATEKFRQALNGESPQCFELNVRSRTGTGIPMELTITPEVRRGAVTGVLGIARDIRERRNLEEKSREVRNLESVGRFAAGVAHDFNNFLTVQQGHISLLLTDPEFPARYRDSVCQISNAGDRAAALTRQLLTFGRKPVVQTRRLDLNEVVADFERLLGGVIDEGIELGICLAESLPPVEADALLIEQVILNLVVNACDAMPKGGHVEIRTDTACLEKAAIEGNPEARPGEFVYITISDTGKGIPPGVRERIFEPFFTTKEAQKGVGLGLATVHGIVKQHRGWIDLHSRPGGGTTFKVFLPVAVGDAVTTTEARADEEIRRGTETILVAEDDAAVRQMVKLILERQGYRVLTADRGTSAMVEWERYGGEIDLLLVDLVMPGGMSGMDLVTRLRREKPCVKAILTSGEAVDVSGKKRCRGGDYEFLQKPYDLRMLVETIQSVLMRG